MLKGNIYITDNVDIIYSARVNDMNKILSLDEDNSLMESNDVICGTCLLPPINAKIAEADGNELLYDQIYSGHLLEPYQQQVISALIAFLYKGGNLLIFLPDEGYDNTMDKFIFHMYNIFGIHIGKIGDPNPAVANCYYDNRCLPIWLNMIYSCRVISAREYLYMYPEDAVINNDNIMAMLISDIQPYADTINDKKNYILRYHKLIHKNPKIVPAIRQFERMVI